MFEKANEMADRAFKKQYRDAEIEHEDVDVLTLIPR